MKLPKISEGFRNYQKFVRKGRSAGLVSKPLLTVRRLVTRLINKYKTRVTSKRLVTSRSCTYSAPPSCAQKCPPSGCSKSALDGTDHGPRPPLSSASGSLLLQRACRTSGPCSSCGPEPCWPGTFKLAYYGPVADPSHWVRRHRIRCARGLPAALCAP